MFLYFKFQFQLNGKLIAKDLKKCGIVIFFKSFERILIKKIGFYLSFGFFIFFIKFFFWEQKLKTLVGKNQLSIVPLFFGIHIFHTLANESFAPPLFEPTRILPAKQFMAELLR